MSVRLRIFEGRKLRKGKTFLVDYFSVRGNKLKRLNTTIPIFEISVQYTEELEEHIRNIVRFTLITDQGEVAYDCELNNIIPHENRLIILAKQYENRNNTRTVQE